MSRQPPGAPPPPPVQRIRLRYTKRGRLRFTSHRDIARVFERALRRAEIPMAYSAGFSPHPKVSWVGAAATGVASEAEYVEIALAEVRDVESIRIALNASLPDGIDLVEAVEAEPGTSLADRVQASRWHVELPDVPLSDLARAVETFLAAEAVEAEPGTSLADRVQASRWHVELPDVPLNELARAVETFLAAEAVEVERMTKNGRRLFDTRGPVVSMTATAGNGCAILSLVVQHVTPAVRPDDVLTGLRQVSDLATPVPPAATRLSQGPLIGNGEVGDPLAPENIGATRQDAEAATTDFLTH